MRMKTAPSARWGWWISRSGSRGRSRQGSLERLSSRCVTSPTLDRSDAAARSIDWVPTAVREGQQSSSTINSEEERTSPGSTSAGARPATERNRVLVVDDNRDAADSIAEIPHRAGVRGRRRLRWAVGPHPGPDLQASHLRARHRPARDGRVRAGPAAAPVGKLSQALRLIAADRVWPGQRSTPVARGRLRRPPRQTGADRRARQDGTRTEGTMADGIALLTR